MIFMMANTKQYEFPVDARVVYTLGETTGTGVILGMCADVATNVQFYIVLLDVPIEGLPDRAITVPSGCLRRLENMGQGLLTVSDVRDELDEIKRRVGDPESAHGCEDRLYQRVLQAIAEGAQDPDKLASEALKARDIDFPRWYA